MARPGRVPAASRGPVFLRSRAYTLFACAVVLLVVDPLHDWPASVVLGALGGLMLLIDQDRTARRTARLSAPPPPPPPRTDDVLRGVLDEICHDLDPRTRVESDASSCSLYAGDRLLVTAPIRDDLRRDAVVSVMGAFRRALVEDAGRMLPRCGDHDHPAVLRTTALGVAWLCPETGEHRREYPVARRPVAH